MKSAQKHAFYPDPQVAKILKKIPRGHLSERVNDLILKGIFLEKQQELARAYELHSAELLKSPKANYEIMSKGAFTAEDEEEDFI
jgi:hypothetical protein